MIGLRYYVFMYSRRKPQRRYYEILMDRDEALARVGAVVSRAVEERGRITLEACDPLEGFEKIHGLHFERYEVYPMIIENNEIIAVGEFTSR